MYRPPQEYAHPYMMLMPIESANTQHDVKPPTRSARLRPVLVADALFFFTDGATLPSEKFMVATIAWLSGTLTVTLPLLPISAVSGVADTVLAVPSEVSSKLIPFHVTFDVESAPLATNDERYSFWPLKSDKVKPMFMLPLEVELAFACWPLMRIIPESWPWR